MNETCRGPECDRPITYKPERVCNSHREQLKRNPERSLQPLRKKKNGISAIGVCTGPECDRPCLGGGSLCSAHVAQLQRRPGTPLTSVRGMRDSTVRNTDGHKECGGCREWLSERSFSRGTASADGLQVWCVECMWSAQLKHKYNITRFDYEAMLGRQNGVCGICGEVDDDRRLAVDHDHSCCHGQKSCGKCVRGLLCRRCNTVIGHCDDDIDLLMSAVKYLGTNKSSSR